MSDSNRYLIIGGSTKCGTTSVFKYFEFHPEVCAAEMKESRYFLDDSYQLEAATRNFASDTSFGSLFRKGANGCLRLEATPDYLYAQQAALRIRATLSEVKLVFVLRDPVSRLISWYRFAKMNGLTGATSTFDDFVNNQSEHEEGPQHLQAKLQGKYFNYLQNYIEVFGRDNILITYFEHLSVDPGQFCKEICEFAGISTDYFDQYDFKVYNKSADAIQPRLHRQFRKLKRAVRPIAKMAPAILQKRLKLAGHYIESGVVRLNSVKNAASQKTFTTEGLKEYYTNSVQQLKTISKVPESWLAGK